MSNILSELRTKRENTWLKMQHITDTALRFGRDVSAGEAQRFDTLNAELDQLDERIAQLADQEDRDRLMREAFAPYEAAAGARVETSEVLDEFRSAVLENHRRPIVVREHNPRFVSQPGVERRDLLTSAPANFRPVSFYGQIVEAMTESSAVLKAGATVLTTDSGEDMRVPRATARSTAAIVAEAAAIGESDPTLDVVTLRAYKYGVFFQVSREMMEDTSGVDLQGYLARQAGEAIGQALGAHLLTGTGSGQPEGAAVGATVGVTGPTGTATSFGSQATAGQGTDLLNSLYGSLAEPYVTGNSSPGFLLRNATLTSIRNLKTSAGEVVGSSYLASPPAPFYVDPFVAAMGANNKSVIFGDWSRYFVRMVNGIRFERSDDFAFDRDLVSFRCVLRADGRLIDSNALKAFAHSAT